MAPCQADSSAGIDYWVIRVGRDVLQLALTRDHARNNMPVDLTDKGIGISTVTLIGFPRGVDVHDNRFHAYAGHGGAAVVSFLNASESSVTGNEVHSYSGERCIGLKFGNRTARSGQRCRAGM